MLRGGVETARREETDQNTIVLTARLRQHPDLLIREIQHQTHADDKETGGNPDEDIKAYLDWILHDGQVLVSELGFVPAR